MMTTDCSKSAAARAGSVTRARLEAAEEGCEPSASRAALIGLSVTEDEHRHCPLRLQNRILDLAHDSHPGHFTGSPGWPRLRQLSQRLPSRWPAGESVVKPRSHCRVCNRTLAWWENIPILSWLALRGRCRTCGEPNQLALSASGSDRSGIVECCLPQALASTHRFACILRSSC